MTKPADLPADTTPEPAETPRPRRLRWLTQPVASPVHIAALGVGGALLMGVVAAVAMPGMPLWWYAWESVESGFMAPLLMAAVLMAFSARRALVEMCKDRAARRSHTVAVAVFAARVRYYQSIGNADPLAAATYDLGGYLSRRVAVETRLSWESAAVTWYSTGPAASELAAPPRSLLKNTETGS